MSRAVLTVEELVVEIQTRRGVLRAVDQASCTLMEGKTHCLVGESGSGKSVFARALLNLLPRNASIRAGRVVFERHETEQAGGAPESEVATSFRADSAEMRRLRTGGIGMIFQEPMSALSPVHTCGDTIATGIRLRWPGISRAETRTMTVDILRQMRIPDPEKTAYRYPFELSGGMRQRVCIALAMVRRPKLLIADEPTTALDVTTQREILTLIETMKREYGLSVLLITHDMGIAAQVADDITVMQSGRFVERQATIPLFDAPAHDYTRHLISSTMALERAAASKELRSSGGGARLVLDVRGIGMSFVSSQGPWLRKKLHVVRALDGLSFQLRAGEVLGIVGESGSGKTTLARCIAGLHRSFEGSVLLHPEGTAPVELSAQKDRRAGQLHRQIRMVFQDPFASLNPRLNIYNNVAEPLLIAGIQTREARARVTEMLRRVALPPDVMERYPHAFSGGQRQRICVARAAIVHPSVLIADEATGSLDVSLRKQILDLLLELQAAMHFGLILITHDISAVRYCADRMLVMKSGKVVEEGDVTRVLEGPQEQYTKALIAAVPRVDPHRRTLVPGLDPAGGA